MQMTTEAQTKVTVQEVLAEKIMERLNRLAASEERELRGAFSKIPARVYETALERLSIMEMIRKVQSRQDGVVYVAKADATREELAAASRRYRKVEAQSDETTFHAKIFGITYAQRMPKPAKAERPGLDPEDAGATSQTETFGLSYEAAAQASFEEAVLPFESEAAETASILNRELVTKREVGAHQQSLIQRQLKSGQGSRNTKRAQRRYFAKPEKQMERRIHEHAQRVLAEEKARFNRPQP
jgi:hypothetical protein